MKDKEIRKNGSGYFDPTAYEAIKKTPDMKKGEIWEVKQNVSGAYKNVIVISVHDKITTILQINDFGDETCIEVNCQGIKYTDPCRLQYAFNDTFCNFVRTLKAEEFEKVMKAVADGLELNISVACEEVAEPFNYDESSKPCAFIPLPETPDLFDIETIKEAERAKAERDVYKGLYEKLLSDVIKG